MEKLFIGILILSSLTYCKTKPDNPQVRITTTSGEIILELYPEKAPAAAANFLEYVDRGLFQNATFYRTVTLENQPDNDIKIEVVQGGLWFTDTLSMLDVIPHETTEHTGIRHKHGTISMARNEPGSASSEFFICINDQPSLDFGGGRNPDGQGFAAFGKAISGMDIVTKIHQSPNTDQLLSPSIEITSVDRLN